MNRRAATVADLLTALASGVTTPGAVRGALGGISASTLSRLVDEAGDNVLRIGRTRASMYGRTRVVEGLGRSIPVFRVSGTGAVSSAGRLHCLWGTQTYWEGSGARSPFAGLPPAFVDMAPQGYLGQAFPARFPELGLPPRITDWSDDHRLIALARRGEDCVGDLIVGDESLQRFVSRQVVSVGRDDYPGFASRSAIEAVGSSAGGERPKFGAFSRGRHVLVKFAVGGDSAAARRWRDLLWCEWRALHTVAASGHVAAPMQLIDQGEWRFLELDRFDREGESGRLAVLSLSALNSEYFGSARTWTDAVSELRRSPFLLPEDDARNLRWLDVFGQLIGNTDRHLGNMEFFVGRGSELRLAPSYDMLPMILAPSGEQVVARTFTPAPPTGSTLDVWLDAAEWAQRFWSDVEANTELASDVRAFAVQARQGIAGLARGMMAQPVREAMA